MNESCHEQSPVESPAVFDGRVPPPEFVSIETTRYCNFKCPMCLQFQDGTTVTGPHMDQELFEAVAAATFPHARRFQPSISGEPLMSKGLPFMLSEAQRYGVKTEICSNASLLNRKMRDAVLPSLGKLIVSFDGATKDTFEWVREGAEFEVVVDHVTALCKQAQEVPLASRPLIGLACVLMRRNIEELPQLVDLAVEIGVDYLATSHVHPVTDEMKLQSLVHHVDLAVSCIDKALARAEDVGLTMMVQPLDQLIASTAISDAERRTYALSDGVVAGLGHHVVNLNSLRQFPFCGPDDAEYNDVIERRRAAADDAEFVVQTPPNPGAEKRESIWICDFLWNKTYIALDGQVKACCVPGTPNLGDLNTESFSEVWNSAGYVRMRENLARKEPVPFCKGCQHIRELTDPSDIDFWLQGRRAPQGHDPRPLPHLLDPHRARADGEAGAPELMPGQELQVESDSKTIDVYSSPPTLIWSPAADVPGYVLEFSLDSFETTQFATNWNGQPLLIDPNYRVPDWGWELAPEGAQVWWRAFAAEGDREAWVEVGSGSFVRENAN